MKNVLETLASANESSITALTTAQERVLELHRELANTVTKPAVASWVPTPDSSLAADAVEQAYSFSAQLAQANKDFAIGVIQAWAPAQKAAAKK